MLLVVFDVFDAIFLGKDILAPAKHRHERQYSATFYED